MLAHAKTEEQVARLTPEEYLERERQAETRSEYDCGVLVAMAGASLEHNLIVANIQAEIHNQMKGTPCTSVAADMRVHIRECARYYYPDIVVFCGEAQLEDSERDTLLNPTIIIEVLSL